MSELEAQKYIFKMVDYEPTEAQWVIHRDPTRNPLVTGGERAGKSKFQAGKLVERWYLDVCIPKKSGALYWLLGNDYEACRGEWEHIVEAFIKLGQIKSVTKNIDPGELVLLDGTVIVTKSAKYPEKIATVAPDGIVICEAAQVDYEIFLRARSRVAEKRGWVSMAGTLEEEDYVSWYRELYEVGQSYNNLELKSFSLPTWTNLVIFPGGRTDPELMKLEAGMTKERFMERFGGVPYPKVGRVVQEFANAIHVKPCEFDKNLPVSLAVDPGYAGASAVLAIQDLGERIALIDEVYVTGVVTHDIITICKKRIWWDAVSGGAIDIAAKQHQAMPAPIEVWISVGGVSLMTKKIMEEDGIDLLRTHMKQHPVTGAPGITVDPKCRGFISECGGGKSPVDGGGLWMRDKNTLKPIDKNNHACKALIYYLANKYGYTGSGKFPQPLKWTGRAPRQTFIRT